MASLISCKGNLSETILGCIIEDDVLVGVAVLFAKGPYLPTTMSPRLPFGLQKLVAVSEVLEISGNIQLLVVSKTFFACSTVLDAAVITLVSTHDCIWNFKSRNPGEFATIFILVVL